MRGGEGDGLRRTGDLRKDHVESSVLEDLCSGEREIAREKSSIESNDERVAIDVGRWMKSARRDCNRFAYTANVLEREAVGDDSAPAVSAKGDLCHPGTLLTKDAA